MGDFPIFIRRSKSKIWSEISVIDFDVLNRLIYWLNVILFRLVLKVCSTNSIFKWVHRIACNAFFLSDFEILDYSSLISCLFPKNNELHSFLFRHVRSYTLLDLYALVRRFVVCLMKNRGFCAFPNLMPLSLHTFARILIHGYYHFLGRCIYSDKFHFLGGGIISLPPLCCHIYYCK